MKRFLSFTLVLFTCFLTMVIGVSAKATWTTISLETTNLGYGVTLDKYHGTSTSDFNTLSKMLNRQQDIYTLNIPNESSARVVQWSINKANNAWGSYTLETIAADYESTHPNEKVIAATNNWLSDTLAGNVGELDGVQVCDGLNYRVTDKQGTADAPAFKHDYIPRDYFLGFDATGKKAYFTDDWNDNNNYTDKLALSYWNGTGQARTMLNINVDKINEAPGAGEIAIIFPNYNGTELTFSGSTIYKMQGKTLRYDSTKGTGSFVERDAFALGTFTSKVDAVEILPGKTTYYIVSNNSTFNSLDLTDKTLVAQYELLGDFTNAIGGTTYYFRIVRNGEVYPGTFGHWNEINCEIHPRTAFVIKEDGSFALSVIDGRQSFKTGMDYEDMANFYKTMYNGYNVFNYDGGGSSCMIVANNKGGYDIVNSPSDGRERRVANANLVVVDRQPFDVSQTDVQDHNFTITLANVGENVESIYATVNGEKREFVGNSLTFENIKQNAITDANISYKLKNSDVEKIGTTVRARTCNLFAKIRNLSFDDIKQDGATLKVSILDEESSFFQGIVEVGDFKEYFKGDSAEVNITKLKASTDYDVKVSIVSKNGTMDNHTDVYHYSLKTTKAEYPEELVLTVKDQNMEIGTKQTMTVEYVPLGTKTILYYASSNESVATVSSIGSIKAIAEGTTTITVSTKEGITATLEITVAAPKPTYPSELLPSVNNEKMTVGTTQNIVVAYNPADTKTTLTYESSNENVLTVSSDGVISAVAEGNATITITSKEGVKATLAITVEKAVSKDTEKGCKKKSAVFVALMISMASVMAFVFKRHK